MKRSEALRMIQEWEEIFSTHYECWETYAIDHPEKLDFFKMEAVDIGRILKHTSEVADFILDNNDIQLYEDYSSCNTWVNQMMDIWEKRIFLYGTQNDEYYTPMSMYFDRASSVFHPLYAIKRLLFPECENVREGEGKRELPKDEQLEVLKGYFNASFKGYGNNKNYFDIVVRELQRNLLNGKDLAAVLSYIYSSKQVNRDKLPSFKQWLSLWGDFLGVHIPDYRQSILDTTIAERMFGFYFNPHK